MAASSGIDSTRVHDAFAHLARMPESLPKAIGLAGLIARNDPAGVVGLERDFSAIAESDLSRIIAGPLYGRWRNPDPAGVSSLGRVLTKGACRLYRSAIAGSELHGDSPRAAQGWTLLGAELAVAGRLAEAEDARAF